MALSYTQLAALLINSLVVDSCSSPLDVLDVVKNQAEIKDRESLNTLCSQNVNQFGEVSYDQTFARQFLRELEFSSQDIDTIFKLLEDYIKEILK
tara:strand:- start:134 stop:418 length:285 start_codon:yes stop_codon:yes gene_type:complete